MWCQVDMLVRSAVALEADLQTVLGNDRGFCLTSFVNGKLFLYTYIMTV